MTNIILALFGIALATMATIETVIWLEGERIINLSEDNIRDLRDMECANVKKLQEFDDSRALAEVAKLCASGESVN